MLFDGRVQVPGMLVALNLFFFCKARQEMTGDLLVVPAWTLRTSYTWRFVAITAHSVRENRFGQAKPYRVVSAHA